METLQEREQRIKRLEQQRASKHADIGTVWPTPDDAGTSVVPVEIAPGRGNLDRMSGFYPAFPIALSMVGRTVSFARLAMSQPWVAAAIRWTLSRAIRVPLKVYRSASDDPADRIRLNPDEHPLAAALLTPNAYSQAELVMSLLGPILVHGNSVTRVDQGATGSLGLDPKDWRFCRPIMPFRDTIDGFKFDYDQPAYMQEESIDKVLHIKYWSPTGPIGVSPLQELGVTLQIEDAAQRFQRALFAGGARPPWALTASNEFLGIERAERQQILNNLRADITALFSGPDNAGKPLVLPPGLDAKEVGQTTVEAALIDQRKITREEIAAVYQIPPPLMGILDRATYSNIETQRDLTYTDCLGPPLILLEQAINTQVGRNLLQETDVFCEFDFGAVLRGDRLSEIAALRDAIGTGLMTPNEGRNILNMKKDANPAMDEFYLPANNLQPVSSLPTGTGDGQVPPNQDPGWSPDPGPPEPQRGKRLHVRSRERDYALNVDED